MNRGEQLIARALAGPLDAAEQRELCDLLQQQPALREAFAAHAALHACLGPALEDELAREKFLAGTLQAARAADAADFTAKVRRKLTSIRRRRMLTWMATATAAAALVLLVFFMQVGSPPAAALATVARIAAQDSASTYRVGDPFGPGSRLHLQAGLVELDLQGRGTMIVEGPLELEFTGPLGATLKRGRVLLHVNARGYGYKLTSPQGSIVDLGTTFGVAVDELSGEVETHVLAGEVKTFPGDGNEVVLLQANQALRLGASSQQRIPMNADAFYTALPPIQHQAVRMVHWPMESVDAPGSGTRTHGFADVDYALRFPVAPDAPDAPDAADAPLPELPKSVDGPFGQALFFDGAGRYAESHFRGIAGAKERTVAFWVKVPEHFDLEQGYSMLSWGQFAEENAGSVWQVSVNPDKRDGPVGRLRVGVHGGKAIGTTDLRDGRWHHLAVVLYGVPGREFGKNVLLYVNGELEPLSRRVLGVMDTQIGSADHGVWFGRDVTSAAHSGRFFRGGLDEVYIFDAALTQEQVRELMERNQPPIGEGKRSHEWTAYVETDFN